MSGVRSPKPPRPPIRQSERRSGFASSRAFLSEPPAEADVHRPRPANNGALVADMRVVKLDRDVRLDPEGSADDTRLATELGEPRGTRRHFELRVEVFVSHESRGAVR